MISITFCPQSTPKSIKGLSKKEGAKRKINMSGYILFSSEMRAVIKAQHPDFSFGELSRLVGTEWRNLEATKKAEYEGEVLNLSIYHKIHLCGHWCMRYNVSRFSMKRQIVFIFCHWFRAGSKGSRAAGARKSSASELPKSRYPSRGAHGGSTSPDPHGDA